MTATGEAVPEEQPLSNADLYDLLADTRRRYTLHYLKQHDGPVDVRELAEQVAAWENSKSVAELTSQERKRVYISLYQSHLSTLDDDGVVEYDESAGRVQLTDELRSVDVYLEIVPKNSIPWSSYYIGLSVAGLIAVALTTMEFAVFSQMSELGVTTALLGVYAVSALVQAYQHQRTKLGDDGPPPSITSN